MSVANRARTAGRQPTVAESSLRSAPLNAPPALLPLLYSLYAFPRPATPQPFQLLGPRPLGARAGGPAAAEPFPLRGRYFLPCQFARFPRRRGAGQLFRRVLVVRRRVRPDNSPGARDRGGSRSAQILANWPDLSPRSSPRARDAIRSTILPPWLTRGFCSARRRAFAAQQHGRGIVRAAL